MATLKITAHNGKTLAIDVPEGTPQEQYGAMATQAYNSYKAQDMEVQKRVESEGQAVRFNDGPSRPSIASTFMPEGRDPGDEGLTDIRREAQKQLDTRMHGGVAENIADVARAVDPTGMVPEKKADVVSDKGLYTASNDAQYGDIWFKQLEAAGHEPTRTKDSKGREIIEFTGKDGQRHRGYVNMPEWDATDIQRIVQQWAPSVIAGGIGSAALKGAGALVGMGAQALMGGGEEVAKDLVAGAQGSEQGVDPVRAFVAAVGAGAGEGAGRLYNYFANSVGGKQLFGKLKSGKPLAPKEQRFLKSIGIDEATARERASMSMGQFADDPGRLKIEAKAREGKYGPGGEEIARGRDIEADAAMVEQYGPKHDQQQLGQAMQEGWNTPRAAAKKAEREAWDTVKQDAPITLKGELKVRPTGEAPVDPTSPMTGRLPAQPVEIVKEMPAQARKEWTGFKQQQNITDEMSDEAKEVLGYVEGYIKRGGMTDSEAEGIDTVRREINRRIAKLETGTEDRTLANEARRVKRAFEGWVSKQADNELLEATKPGATGKQALANLKKAINVTKEERRLYNPAAGVDFRRKGDLKDYVKGKEDAGRLLDRIFDGNKTTPEQLARTLFGRPGSKGPDGAKIAIQQIMKVSQKGKKPGMLGTELRRSYVLNTMLDNEGAWLPPDKIVKNIRKQFAGQKTIIDELGIGEVLRHIERHNAQLMKGRAKSTPGKGINIGAGPLLNKARYIAMPISAVKKLWGQFWEGGVAARSLKQRGRYKAPAGSKGLSGVGAKAGAAKANALYNEQQREEE